MRNVIETIKASIEAGEKLATAKESLAKESAGKDVDGLGLALQARTKAAFVQQLDAILDSLGQDDPREVEVEALTRLEEITNRINHVVAQQANNYFEIAKLLAEAKAEFDTTQEFLSWADDSFSFKKAYVYRILQVSTKFSEPVWHDTPIGNLYILMQQGTEADIENAKMFIEKGGMLTRPNLSVLLDGQAQNAKPAVKKPTAQETVKELEDATRSVSGAIVDDAVSDVELKVPESGTSHRGAPGSSTVAQTAPDNEAHMAQIAELTRQVGELTRQLAEATKPKLRDLKSIPMLRQFNSPCLRTRLGLSEEEAHSKETILEAFKDFCRAGYGRGHDAFVLLDEARHKLIHSIPVAA